MPTTRRVVGILHFWEMLACVAPARYTLGMALYHSDIRLPQGFRLPNRIVALRWTRHALNACEDDRYGEIPCVPALDLATCRTVEVEVFGKRVNKVVVRTELDDEADMVLVLIPGPAEWTVKTVWINLKSDTHRTLDRSKYVR